MKAPFPYFGGKSKIVARVWERLGCVNHYIEPFCGSAAMLLAAPRVAPLEVVSDANGFIANFWRAIKCQPMAAAAWADYPVSHVDLGARHAWLLGQADRLGAELQDPDWPGDPKVAGWWVWGQCCWIGSGWCQPGGQVPQVNDTGMGIQAKGRIPHVSDAGMGIQAKGKIPHVGDAITSGGRAALAMFGALASRLERVRVLHGDWSRCLNNHYGGAATAVFFDPPYVGYDGLYGTAPIARDVEEWARAHPDLRVAICGHAGDYSLPGWETMRWDRGRLTYGGGGTTAAECVWFSPSCVPDADLFGA